MRFVVLFFCVFFSFAMLTEFVTLVVSAVGTGGCSQFEQYFPRS